MFGLQYCLTRLDIESTKEKDLRKKKELWLNKWTDNVFKKSFFGFIGASPPKSEEEIVLKLSKIKDKDKLLLIAFECTSFTPYFNIQHKESENVTKELPLEHPINKEWEQNLPRILRKTKVDLKKIELGKHISLNH